jgi:type IX secretion system PorP/SprF family membrane protein
MPLFYSIFFDITTHTVIRNFLHDKTCLIKPVGMLMLLIQYNKIRGLNFPALLLFLFSFAAMIQTKAQEVGFSQFYAAPLYLNPAFAGQTECGRIGLQYRNQWPGLDKAFRTYKLSYDQHLPAINSGFGFQLMQDQQGGGVFNRTMIATYFASQVQVGMRSMIAAGIKGGLVQDALNWDALQFPDKLINGASNESPPNATTRWAPDFAAGLLYSLDEVLFAGISADHVNRPLISMFGEDNNTLPVRWTLHTGWNIRANDRGYAGRNDELLLIQPNALFLQQGKFRQLNAGLYVSKHPFIAGGWFRHTFETANAIEVMVGLNASGFSVGYSYDITVSGVGLNAGGAHEVSLSWELCIERETKRKIRAIKSPVF